MAQQVCAPQERGRSDAHLDLRWTLRGARPATAGLTWRPTSSYSLRTSIIKTSCGSVCYIMSLYSLDVFIMMTFIMVQTLNIFQNVQQKCLT